MAPNITLKNPMRYLLAAYLFLPVLIEDQSEFLASFPVSASAVISMLFLIFLFVRITIENIAIKLNLFFFIYTAFVLFSLASANWAIDKETVLEVSVALFAKLFLVVLLFSYFASRNQAEDIVYALVYYGILLSIYCVSFYGIEEVLDLTRRLSSDMLNTNVLGMNVAAASICSYFIYLKYKKTRYLLYIVPLAVIVLAAASRKGILMLFLGIVLLFVFYSLDTKNLYNMAARFLLILLASCALFLLFINLETGNASIVRFQTMINYFIGAGDVDGSTLVRMEMIDFGWRLFEQNPIVGIGINNAKFYFEQYSGRLVYLHNNYIELLTGVGIVGFALYYSIFILIIVKLWPQVKKRDMTAVLGFILMILSLIMDYGAVSYRANTIYIYIVFTMIIVAERGKRVPKQRYTITDHVDSMKSME